MYKMETLIKTETSFLRQIDFSKNALIILLACDLIKSKFEENLKWKYWEAKNILKTRKQYSYQIV